MGILPVLKVKTESRCNLLTTILYDSSLSFSMMVKDIGPVRVLWRLKVLTAVYQLFIVAEYTEGYFEFQGIGEVRMINGKSLK